MLAMIKPLVEISVADPISVRNLTVFPLLSKGVNPAPEYIASSVAIEEHGLQVEEIVQQGSVPNLMVINPASVAVLLLDGEELRGAKQNRIVNTSILIPPESRTKIDVSCTERGRWRYTSKNFSHSKTIMAAKLRRRKSRAVSKNLQSNKSFASNQGEVWQNIAELNAKIGSHSETSAMAAAYEAAREELNNALEHCACVEHQQGLLVFIDGKPAGLDFLSQRSVYQTIHPQLLQSYAMEALASERRAIREAAQTPQQRDPKTCSIEEATDLISQCAKIEGKAFPSVGLGEDWRFQKESIIGSGLQVDKTWVHMAYFWEDEPHSEYDSTRVARFRASRQRLFVRPHGPID